MKRIIPIFIALAAVAVIFFSCKREYPVHSGYSGVEGFAFLKVVHASPNFRALYGQPDSVNVFVSGSKINATPLKFNTAFPGTINTYAEVPAGAQTIKLSVGVTNPDSMMVVTWQKTLTAGAYYTLVITDSLTSPRDSSRIWVQDTYPKPAAGAGYTYLRFINAVLDDSAGTTVNIYSPRRNQTIFSKVKIDSITPFSAIPSITGGTLDTLYVTKSNTGAILAKLLPTTPFGDQQYYTVYYIGDTTVAVGKPRTLVSFQNK